MEPSNEEFLQHSQKSKVLRCELRIAEGLTTRVYVSKQIIFPRHELDIEEMRGSMVLSSLRNILSKHGWPPIEEVTLL